MPSTDDYLVGSGAVASSHHSPYTLYRLNNSVHVSPCFGAPSCFFCLAEVALPQDEVGTVGDPGWPGDGDSGLQAQCVDMTRQEIYDMTKNSRSVAAGQQYSAGAPNLSMYMYILFLYFILFARRLVA